MHAGRDFRREHEGKQVFHIKKSGLPRSFSVSTKPHIHCQACAPVLGLPRLQGFSIPLKR
ncbi:hypothetical protein C4E21_06205 [Bacillus subtilis]|nr:hypothetical protein C4E21_06205 [Bacillus subtilis]RFM38061.1 hypothetical protein D0N38_15980 [Bacillus inaquosorum]